MTEPENVTKLRLAQNGETSEFDKQVEELVHIVRKCFHNQDPIVVVTAEPGEGAQIRSNMIPTATHTFLAGATQDVVDRIMSSGALFDEFNAVDAEGPEAPEGEET